MVRSMGFFGARITPNPGTCASIKRLIFEAPTLLSADLQNKVHKTDDQNQVQARPS